MNDAASVIELWGVSPPLQELTADEFEIVSAVLSAKRKTKGITVEERAVPKAVLRLCEANFPDDVLEGIEAGKYGPPTDIQAQCWLIALKGRDLKVTVHGGARGKTLAYLLPAIVHVMHQPPLQSGDGPIVLVLVATPELARQTHELNCHFEKYTAVRSVCLSCGDRKLRQLKP
ncbi:uncharacterized protein LOC142559331 [Dermacentor variabilis]|uniref:uncharacterized protein LOC142559331 n=1 Tax=Dermacentor variabilis TaxID=34621 RepID=UPI003F5C13E2